MTENSRDGPLISPRLINWRKSWPVFLGLLLLSFNVEIVIMNILSLHYGIMGLDLFKIGAVLGNIEMVIWIWLFGKIGIFIKENPGFKVFYSNIKSKGIDKIFRKTVKAIADRLDPENIEYLEKIKNIRIGYFDMFLFGICFGAWVLGIIIFRIKRQYFKLGALMLGNTIKIGLFAAGYSFLGLFFLPILVITFVYKINKILNK